MIQVFHTLRLHRIFIKKIIKFPISYILWKTVIIQAYIIYIYLSDIKKTVNHGQRQKARELCSRLSLVHLLPPIGSSPIDMGLHSRRRTVRPEQRQVCARYHNDHCNNYNHNHNHNCNNHWEPSEVVRAEQQRHEKQQGHRGLVLGARMHRAG